MTQQMWSAAMAATLLSVTGLLGCDANGGACTAGQSGCICLEGNSCESGLDCIEGMCTGPDGSDGAIPRMDGSLPSADGGIPDVGPNPDAFFATDPPPMLCLEDGTMGPVPDPPGGTPECPDDKNREGCRCDGIGETAPCWPGLRVNRNRGVCLDGVTTCESFDEFTGRWGACQNAILPTADTGPAACQCFSAGRWEIDNTSPCFVTAGDDRLAVSTYISGSGAACPTEITNPPAPQPGENWSTDRLTVDCEGRFNLCYTLKAGTADSPNDTDCTVARVCTGEFWYAERDTPQELPPLPAWTGTDSACNRQFMETGGYGEMSVRGVSVECDPIDDGSGQEYVFSRNNYCPFSCNTNPDTDECRNCTAGGSGMF